MQASRFLSLLAATVLVSALGASAVASPAVHLSEQSPPRPPTGSYHAAREVYVVLDLKVRKVGKNSREVTGITGRLTKASLGFNCSPIGAFTIPGKLPVTLIKVSSKQKVWGVAKKFRDDSMVPVDVTMKFKTASLKAKLSLEFDPHQKAKVGYYEFGNGGYLEETDNSDCGSAFALKR
jgi:hypothetical protein